MKVPRMLVLVTALLLVSSCAQATPREPLEGAGALGGTQWRLTELNGAAPVEGSSITVQFSEDGSVAGSGGCNRFNAGFAASDNGVEVKEPMASTAMACDEAVMEQETAFFTALGEAYTFTMSEDALTLISKKGAELAKFAADNQDLEDTEWTLVAYNNGKEAVVSVLDGSETNFAFAADGTLSGTAGCNRMNGSFTTEDGTIEFGEIATTRMACPKPEGVMDQEFAVIEALGSAATYRVEGDSLEMRTDQDAIALQFRRA